MKNFSLILCSLILFLVTLPSLKLLSINKAKAESCCNEICNAANNQKQQEQKENCSGNFCNPFAICCACVLHVFSTFNYNIQKPDIITLHQFNYYSNFKSHFAFDFWQPPKLV